jgi:PGF-CTERM protein
MSIELPLRRAVSLALVALLVVSAAGVHAATTPATAQTEEQEPNEDREDANPVGIDENVTGTINTGDTDWFVTENVTRGQTITVNFTNPNDPEANSHRFILYDLNGSEVAGKTVDGNQSIEVGDTVEDSGPYYIEVKDRQSGPYSFVVNVTGEDPETEEQEPNEDREDANPVGIDENVTGTINTGDTDWFVTENVTRGQTITVNFTNPNDPEANSHRFILYDLNGSEVAGKTVDGNQSIEVGDTVEDSGPYYIEVKDRQSGPYSFVVNVTGEGNPETAVEATEAETTAGGTTAGGTTAEGTTAETMTDDATTEEPAPTTAGETTEVPTAEEGTTEPEPTDTAVGETTDPSETTGGSENETTTEAAGGTGVFGPGFGPLLAVVALLAVALYAARRRT